MVYDDIIQEYYLYLDALEEAYYLLTCLLKDTNKYILNTDNSNRDIDQNLNNVEKIFFSISHLLPQFYKIIDECNSVKIEQSDHVTNSLEKSKNDNLIVLPIYPDEDIYVDSDARISDLWKTKERVNLSLIEFDD